MSIFKCKMCGGTLEINENQTTAVCEYCGTTQTLPKLDDDRRVQMYDRANHFRRNNEFDKAMGIYEKILNEDNTDAEAYWSIVLCRYGIEYVEDPATHKRVPTVNRAQFTSIFDDEDYKSALRYADAYQRSIYEEEAHTINEIQKGILAISQKEDPFDVFICYKETDNNGRRTQDSVLANDLYHQLTQEGFKVFFSRITLEDKLGTAYEPYIFAALNSAKVMVVIGTKPEYFNAVWVKNEWSRYLALIKNGAKKILIPAYRDMDPYDLPEEFSHLQAQDMSKLGFMQDLIRGIKKLTETDTPKTPVQETVVVSGKNSDTGSLLKRAFMYLEDGAWQNADSYCERVLDIDPENAEAYLGKMMAEMQIRRLEELKNTSPIITENSKGYQEALRRGPEAFESNGNYQKAFRFADDKLKSELKDIALEFKYRFASGKMLLAKTGYDYMAIAGVFHEISGYKDSEKLEAECSMKAEEAQKDPIFTEAGKLAERDTIDALEQAIELYKSIPGWKNADELAISCGQRLEELKIEQQRKAEQNRIAAEKWKRKAKKIAKRAAIIGTPIIVVVVAFLIVLNSVIIPTQKKNQFIETYGEETFNKFGLVEIGKYISFGKYEQDNDTSNGAEDIEWLVLDIVDGKALLISKYVLDCQPYNTETEDVTWETCTLRTWINDDFYDIAFSDDDKKRISNSLLVASKSETHTLTNGLTGTEEIVTTHGGNSTTDDVFILSREEVMKYSDILKDSIPTSYAIRQGVYVDPDGFCDWWVRSPGWYQSYAQTNSLGSGYEVGNDEMMFHPGVCPAIWIDLEP